MEQTDEDKFQGSQLIYVSRKDTTRLLEVYVKRSISLNDGPAQVKRKDQLKKWTSATGKKLRRHSSDSSIILNSLNDGDVESKALVDAPAPQSIKSVEEEEKPRKEAKKKSKLKKLLSFKERKPRRLSIDSSIYQNSQEEDRVFVPKTSDEEAPPAQPNKSTDEEKHRKKSKKSKKPSFWKSFVGFFTGKDSQQREEPVPSPDHVPDPITLPEMPSPTGANCLPLPGSPASTGRNKPKKRFSKKKKSASFRRDANRHSLIRNSTYIPKVESVDSVEPPYSYYEKVSEELEKIVHEAKETDQNLTNDEVIEKIIALIKHEGDAMDSKLKENPGVNSFFQKMSYSSFQSLADTYVAPEKPGRPGPPTVPHTAPELVKLAFTLDFTARLAGISRQSTTHVMGLGNRYLDERFAYSTQAIPDLPLSSDCE